MVAQLGADYGGIIVEIEQSPRSQALEEAFALSSDPPLPIVAVTLGKSVDDNVRIVERLKPAAIQLHGNESMEKVSALKRKVSCEVWKVIHLPATESGEAVDVEAALRRMRDYIDAGADRLTVDASSMQKGTRQMGGTGKTVDWRAVRYLCERIYQPVILAGGITPANVVEAICAVRPYGVDLSSGVEREKGKKDADMVRSLVTSVRSCETGDAGFRNNPVC
ncbi:MAG: phosphoribosylanthranilate isomerase [Candidatus Omnitrophota bacterium]|jgi:phosphoribosylanthranilate isomerase|nr:MAG: phosphoribosylanthranilate isomerase [Candidatus Omnitrophota bacterium]